MLNLRVIQGSKRERRRRAGASRSIEHLEKRVMLSSAAFAVTSDWGSGFGGQITITNTQSAAVSNWTLSFNWDRSITQIWDGSIVSQEPPTGNQVWCDLDQEDPAGALGYAEDNSSSIVQTPFAYSGISSTRLRGLRD